MKKNKIVVLMLMAAVIASFGLYTNSLLASDEYQYSLNQYQDERRINPIFAQGNKALFGQELVPGTQKVKLDFAITLSKGIIHRNNNVEGQGNLIINESKYPIYIKEGDLEQVTTKDGNELLFGPADGYMEMDGKQVEMVMTFATMPNQNKNLISITFATPNDGIPALVFGEPFQESTDFLSSIKQESKN